MITLDENEKLIAVFRKHIFYVIVEICGLVLVAFIPLVAHAIFRPIIFPNPAPSSIYFFLFLYFLFLAILWVIGFMMWTDYYLDMWVLTDKKLIDVEQKGLFSREISSMRLDKIQDVKSEVSGLIHTFLGIGNVHVQTAGSEKEFVIPNAKNPNKVKEQILSAHNSQVEAVQIVRIENML
ncbi:hypothetical protein A2914_02575 [Candidatus Nomurabacteria bacterium RIFCSPLOWO2_01_FULL_41_21]|uniref:YdbS-like PH domain-containing protein n=2 Tax=Candidatus Nomuraibacteriota TaxID=1752729 RepID=A0A1F6V1K2_9BACT|nr:MAG: hypothetical protein A2733_01730 [Candidatus Nomurabacteria bacterium RIFCSPHIGHO2_01_FULL_40_20]OGI88548.1 MAG: hypothetical protein A2914_02575 [Candidatus Nomurabacteria bacterium RIFCSPLOWO2_01_FULL_41_21]